MKIREYLTEAVTGKEKQWIDKHRSGGRVFVPVNATSKDHKMVQSLMKKKKIELEYDSGSHLVFRVRSD